MAQTRRAYFWTADVELEVNNIAFSLQTSDEGTGVNKKRVFMADWLKDGEVLFNPSQRLKGWLKQQLPLVRSSYGEQVQAVKTFPVNGREPMAIGKADELQGGETIPDANYSLPDGLPLPYHRYIISTSSGRSLSVPLYWYVLPGPVMVKVKIISFARTITPDIVEEALSKLGKAVGLGDKHQHGFGTFDLRDFNVSQEELKI